MLYKGISISEQYIRVKDGKQITMGGNQGWWKDRNDIICDYGCGVIAMCDLECTLYRRNSNNVMGRNEYINYVEKCFRGRYHFSKMPIVRRLGLMPWSMCNGIRECCKAESGTMIEAKWGKNKNSTDVMKNIIGMLEDGIPVVASYDCTLKGKGLPYYRYKEGMAELQEVGKMESHYFTILGICSDLADCNVNYRSVINIEETHHIYLQITTYGQIFYIRFDMWVKQLGLFTNILSFETK